MAYRCWECGQDRPCYLLGGDRLVEFAKSVAIHGKKEENVIQRPALLFSSAFHLRYSLDNSTCSLFLLKTIYSMTSPFYPSLIITIHTQKSRGGSRAGSHKSRKKMLRSTPCLPSPFLPIHTCNYVFLLLLNSRSQINQLSNYSMFLNDIRICRRSRLVQQQRMLPTVRARATLKMVLKHSELKLPINLNHRTHLKRHQSLIFPLQLRFRIKLPTIQSSLVPTHRLPGLTLNHLEKWLFLQLR